jgi:hypothetical protein
MGEAGETRRVAAESVFRRIIRLVVPATMATALSFLCSQMEWYNSAWEHGSPWLQRVQKPIEGFRPSLKSLFWNCVSSPPKTPSPNNRCIPGRLESTTTMAISGL